MRRAWSQSLLLLGACLLGSCAEDAPLEDGVSPEDSSVDAATPATFDAATGSAESGDAAGSVSVRDAASQTDRVDATTLDAAPAPLADATFADAARDSEALRSDAAPNDASGDATRTGPITIWLAGDSTVAKGLTPCPVGWGASFAAHFRSDVNVVNSAVGGRSVHTWLYQVTSTLGGDGECVLMKDASGKPLLQARWQAMLDGMKPGDFLLIQFGINDSAATCDRHVGIEAFKATYGSMAQAAKQRGAQPIFVTPVSAISCSGSAARGSRGAYVTATLDAGKSFDVPVIDLHQRSVELYDQRQFCPVPGGDVSASTGGAVGEFFCDDHTHFSTQGAAQIAALVAQAIREQKLGLSAYLK